MATVSPYLDSFRKVFLCPMTGEGLLILPPLSEDVTLGGVSLHACARADALLLQDAWGWDLSRDDDDLPMPYLVSQQDRRRALGLFGFDPVISKPSLDQLIAATTLIYQHAQFPLGQG